MDIKLFPALLPFNIANYNYKFKEDKIIVNAVNKSVEVKEIQKQENVDD